MTNALTNEHDLGEGIAFFRWHCLRYPQNTDCKGVAEWEDFPLCVCKHDWEHLNG